jgi:glycopeptide antibiotics resistance protein
VPWTSAQDHAHWSRVVWVPFTTPPPLTIPDVLLNVVLYVPFGWIHARAGARRRPRGVSGAVGWAAALSLATEATQVYSHGRFPSMTDVTLNGLGALAGALAARRRAR